MLDFSSINSQINKIKKSKQNIKFRIRNNKKVIELLTESHIPDFKAIEIEENKKEQLYSKKIKTSIESNINHLTEYSKKEIEEYLKERNKYSDKEFFSRIKKYLDQIPESNGSKFYPKMNVNIGIIADEFLFNSFKDMANFYYITKENFKEYAEKLDIFLVVSTWQGLNKEWVGLGNPNNKTIREDLFDIIKYYRKNEIKIVFYSKEDPVNYDIYIDIAKECEYIFTTAEEVIPKYKFDCKNDNVHVLSFGINPVYHNPIGLKKFSYKDKVLFSGSWYNKYPERIKDTKVIFDGVINSGKELKIIDRNYSLKNPRYFFPKQYLRYISPSIPHSYLQKLHKLYTWAINLNSVKDSKTMFANRVYELQAIGNILLSNYSIGVNNLFPNVFLINNTNEVNDILHGYTEEELYKQQIFGIRKVMSNYSTYNKIEELLDIIGFPCKKLKRNIAVCVKSKTNKIKEMFKWQSYPYKELILEKELNEDIMKKFDMITFFDESKNYGYFYLEDMINAFKYTNSDFVTKDAYFNGEELIQGIEHDFVSIMKDKTRTVFWSSSFKAEELLKFNGHVQIRGGYSIDHFEFNNINVIEKKKIDTPYQLSIIVPVFNNGDHLLNKCFNSLRRSSMFEKMEIILVDDGSTDNYTDKIVKRISADYNNVKTYFFKEGGSGSASRPRNKGIELSTAPYVAYLDPDDEAINDGYSKLYEQINKNDYDLVIGNGIKITDKITYSNFYNIFVNLNNKDVITDHSHSIKSFIVNSKFAVQNIQALIFNKKIIIDNSLMMVEGAFGEDTIFFYELMLHSKKVKVINQDIFKYYASVSGSSVNNIGKSFFEKYYILETQKKIPMLKKHKLYNDYLDKKFEYYFKNWYLEKLKYVKQEEEIESIKILKKIFDLYKENIKLKDLTLKRFITLCEKKDYLTIQNEFINQV